MPKWPQRFVGDMCAGVCACAALACLIHSPSQHMHFFILSDGLPLDGLPLDSD
jgi:hypothetical protein